ncbi:MAG: ribosome maturation factor RimM [Firmicutes bacterium]|nr:ribosome maturation factor RimM [Bacillota bacterium]
MKQRYLEAGKIVNTHGIRGEVKLEPWADSPAFLSRLPALYIGGKPYKIAAAKEHKGMLLVKFEGVDDINAAMALKNRVVFLDRGDVKLEIGAFFLQDILGATVVDETGAQLGKLVDIIEGAASNIYVVRGEREILIPAVPAFILNTDTEAGLVTARLIEGM